MRGFKSTLALLVVLAGLGAYIYFVASKADDTASKQERLFPALSGDAIEELTYRDLDVELGNQRLDGVKREIGPGAGAVEVKVELARHFVPPSLACLVVATRRLYLANP